MLFLVRLGHAAAAGVRGFCPQRGKSEPSSGAWHSVAVLLQRQKHDTAAGLLQVTLTRCFPGSTQDSN